MRPMIRVSSRAVVVARLTCESGDPDSIQVRCKLVAVTHYFMKLIAQCFTRRPSQKPTILINGANLTYD